MTGYYLLDNPNPNAPQRADGRYWGRETMLDRPRLVVIHTTESLTDLGGPDTGAENVAAWFTRNDVQASYHTLVDSDSTVRCLPAGLDDLEVHTAWHAGVWNICGIGVSIAMRAQDWPTVPSWWADRVHARLADEVAAVCRRWAIPATHVTLTDAERGAAGIIGHGELDPGYRYDPGSGFDWQRLVADVQARLDPPTPITEDDEMLKPCGTNEGLIVLVDGGTYRVLAGDWPTINAQLIELGRAGMVAVDANGAPVITPIGDNALNALREV